MKNFNKNQLFISNESIIQTKKITCQENKAPEIKYLSENVCLRCKKPFKQIMCNLCYKATCKIHYDFDKLAQELKEKERNRKQKNLTDYRDDQEVRTKQSSRKKAPLKSKK